MARLLRDHPPLRYVLAAGINTLVYTGLTLLLSGPLEVDIQVAIPVAFVIALGTHFSLQRLFVWRHVDDFALRGHEQAARYVVIGVTQYALTAAIVAVVPGWLDASEQLVYLAAVGLISVATFLILRHGVFHALG